MQILKKTISSLIFLFQRCPIYLISNRPGENYPYVIVVMTGAASGSTTSSYIGIKLYGTVLNSKVRFP